MTLKVGKHSVSVEQAVYLMAQHSARTVVSSVTDLTNSAGGTVGTITKLNTNLVNVAAATDNLADKTAAEAALKTVTDGLAELFAKGNAYATKLGVPQVSLTGATATDNTIAAVTVTVTGAATGVPAASVNANLDKINAAIHGAALLTNRIANAVGVSPVKVDFAVDLVNPVPAIPASSGTAVATAVTSEALAAELVKARNAITTLATKLNECNNVATTAYVVAG